MIGTTSRAALGGAAILALALTGCSAKGGSNTIAPTQTARPSAVSATNAAADGCTPQTTTVAADSASQIVQTLIAELPKACGYTISGVLDGAAELPDGLAIQSKATVDDIGNAHVPVMDQGMIVDAYLVSGSLYLRLASAGQPSAAPDQTVEMSWGNVLTSSQVAAAGTNFVKLTASQAAAYVSGGMAGSDPLLAPGTLGKDLTSALSGWTLAGTKTVNGVSCVEVSAPSAQHAPAMTIAVNAATGLPVQVTYLVPSGGSNMLSFSGYGSTARVSAPSGAVDGSSLG